MKTLESVEPTWKELVMRALRDLGGEGHLRDINATLEGHPKTATNPTWRDTIRRVVRQYTVFEPMPPERSGMYRLVETVPPPLEPQKLDASDAGTNHDAAQGMLAALGLLYGYETFVPASDQTTRVFQGRRLGEVVSIRDCSAVFPSRSLPRVRQIDVLWFAEDVDGLYPVYGFEVEHTTNIRDGMDRLLKIPARYAATLFVVGPDDRAGTRFEQLLGEVPLSRYRQRFVFRDYAALEALYGAATEHSSRRDAFGIVERFARD